MPGASVVRRDVSRVPVSDARERIRRATDGAAQTAADSVNGEEARHWERLLIGEIQAGRDPRRPRTRRPTNDATPKSIAEFLDAYVNRCVKPAGLRSIRSVHSRVAALKDDLGELPLDALEEPD